MGGIGKTTLARAIYDKFSSHFQSCCFMENVREESQRINGLSYLLHKLYCKLLEEDNLNTSDPQAKRFIKRRLSRKKLIIVLDDVDTFEQLECLVGEQFYLGLGSKVIITSRDRHVLKGVHSVYEIGELNSEEALELFSLHAFNERRPKMGFEQLSKSAISYAKGIPLALKVLGLHLHSRNKEAWEDALRKLQKHPHTQIQHVLRVSYDGLDAQQKNIFLDIAFFFRGHPTTDVIGVLDACGFYATSGIEQLLDKALITISDDRKLKMHDLLQEMGEQIVREESIRHPARRSRLNDIDDLYDVLERNNGTEDIEGITFDVSRIKKVYLSKDTFLKMPNLRILKLYSGSWCGRSNVNVPFGIDSFPDKIRYFHWDEYPLESLPPTFKTEELVEFHMEHSQVKKLWDGVKDLEKLMKVDVRGSKKLTELPDFSKASKLETLLLLRCESLCRVHPSILSLHTLAHLDIAVCRVLNGLQMAELRSLISLKQLSLLGCKQVNKTGLPILCDALRSLERLDLSCCKNLSEISENISSLSLLTHLNLSGTSVVSLPRTMKHLTRLQHMDLNVCDKLNSIPELPPSLKYLHALFCKKLKTISVPFSNFILEDIGETGKLDLSFKESENLDEQQVMQFTSVSLMQAIHKNFSDPEHEACYPARSIPRWFTYKGTAEDHFVIELDSTSDDKLLGFVVCGILPPLAMDRRLCFSFVLEDHYAYSKKVLDLWDFSSSLAMWFVPFKKIGGKDYEEGRKYDEIGCYYVFEASGQAVPGAECGVCPIYASQFDYIIEKILESNTCDDDDIDHEKADNEIQPHFHINLNRINPPSLGKENHDKQNERKGLQLFQCCLHYLNEISIRCVVGA